MRPNNIKEESFCLSTVVFFSMKWDRNTWLNLNAVTTSETAFKLSSISLQYTCAVSRYIPIQAYISNTWQGSSSTAIRTSKEKLDFPPWGVALLGSFHNVLLHKVHKEQCRQQFKRGSCFITHRHWNTLLYMWQEQRSNIDFLPAEMVTETSFSDTCLYIVMNNSDSTDFMREEGNE